jgi:hypothetical protein
VGGSTVCTILVRFAKKHSLNIIVPDNDHLEGLEGPNVRLPRPLGKSNGDPLDALLGLDQKGAEAEWDLANGGRKRRGGKGRCAWFVP